MKLSTQQLYVNLGIEKEKKDDDCSFFGWKRKKKVVIKSKYCKKCHTEMSNGKCVNDLDCE